MFDDVAELGRQMVDRGVDAESVEDGEDQVVVLVVGPTRTDVVDADGVPLVEHRANAERYGRQ